VSWPKGAEVIQELIDHGHLEQVPANPDEAAYLIDKARLHLRTARTLAEVDPEIAYDALYAAARKALTAVLRQQGLRPTREGGHEAVIPPGAVTSHRRFLRESAATLAELLRPERRPRTASDTDTAALTLVDHA
jgi:hypothetical protein